MNITGLLKKRYFDCFTWLIIDSIFRFRRRVFYTLFTGITSVLMRMFTFFIFIWYIKQFSANDGDIPVFNYGQLKISFANSFDSLYIVALMILVLLVISEIGVFISRQYTLGLNKLYAEFCSQRVVNLLSGNNILNRQVIQNSMLGESILLRSGMKDARICGIALRKLLDMHVPFLTMAAAFIVLLYLSWKLTALVVIFCSGYIIFQGLISKKAANYTVQYEKKSRSVRGKYRDLLRYNLMLPVLSEKQSEISRPVKEDLPITPSLELYVGRQLTISESRLLTGIFSAFVFALIFVFMLYGIQSGIIGWAEILIYLIALRFFLTSLKGLFTQITSLNRMYPGVVRYMDFVQSFDKDYGVYEKQNSYEIIISDPKISHSSKSLTARNGDRITLITPFKLNRYTIGLIMNNLFDMSIKPNFNATHSVQFISSDNSAPGTSYRDILKLVDSEAFSLTNLSGEISEFMQKKIPGDLDKNINPELWRNLDEELRVALIMCHAVINNCQWLIVEENTLRNSAAIFEKFAPYLIDTICLINCGPKNNSVGSYNESNVIVMGWDSCLGAGNFLWHEQNEKEITDIYNKNIPDDRNYETMEGNEDEDDEDELI